MFYSNCIAIPISFSKTSQDLYTRYPNVARVLGLAVIQLCAALRPSVRASKGILHAESRHNLVGCFPWCKSTEQKEVIYE